MKKTTFRFLIFVSLTLIAFIYAYHNLLGMGMMQFGDLIPFPEDPQDAYKTFFFSWDSANMGIESHPDIYYFLIWLFVLIFGNAVIAQKVFYLSALPIAAIGMYMLLGRFIESEPAKYIAAFIYALNPIASYGGPPGPMAFPYALYPFLLLFLLKLLEDKNRLRNTLVFSSVLALALFLSFQGLPTFFVVVVVALFVEFLLRRDFKYLVIILSLILLSLFLVFLLILPVSIFVVISSGQISANWSIQHLINDVRCTYSEATLTRLIRMAGNAGGAPQFLGYNGTDLWTLSGYILPLLAFLSPLLVDDHKKRKYVTIFSLTAILAILQVWLTHKGLTLGLFLRFPILFVFRSPKLLALLSLTYCPLIAISLEEIIRRLVIRKLKLLTGPFILAVIVCLGVYNWPFFTGDMATAKTLERWNTYCDIPSVCLRASSWAREKRASQGFFRTLWLPFEANKQLSLRWLDPYTFSSFIGAEQARNLPNVECIEFVLGSFCSGEQRNLGNLLAPFNVRYVIVDCSSDQEGPPRLSGLYLQGSPGVFAEILNRQRDLILVADKEEFLVYENKKFIPHVSVYDNLCFIDSGPKVKSSRFSLLNPLTEAKDFDIRSQLVVFTEQLEAEEERFLRTAHSELDGAVENFSSKEFEARRVSPTEYRVDLKTDNPVFIMLGETYHPSWNAYVDGKKLAHFKAFYWANGFYLDRAGVFRIKIVFEKQKTRDFLIKVWAFAWCFIFGALVFTKGKRLILPKAG